MSRPTDIVVTTIFEPEFPQGYLRNIDQHGRREEVTFYVIGDRKTPRSVWAPCAEAVRGGFKSASPGSMSSRSSRGDWDCRMTSSPGTPTIDATSDF